MRLSSESENSRQIPEGIKEGSSGGVFPLAVPFFCAFFAHFLRFAVLPRIRAAALTLISPIRGLAGEDICVYIEETDLNSINQYKRGRGVGK